jgi:hypothetical protein
MNDNSGASLAGPRSAATDNVDAAALLQAAAARQSRDDKCPQVRRVRSGVALGSDGVRREQAQCPIAQRLAAHDRVRDPTRGAWRVCEARCRRSVARERRAARFTGGRKARAWRRSLFVRVSCRETTSAAPFCFSRSAITPCKNLIIRFRCVLGVALHLLLPARLCAILNFSPVSEVV